MKRPFFDTSILVAGLIDFGEPSQAAIQILDRVADGRIGDAATAWHCCLEFYSVATRLPEEYRLPPDVAQEFVDEEIMGRLGIEILDRTSQRQFFRYATRNGIRGGRIYDFHIGMIALAHQTSAIVTENKKHFLSFERQGIDVLSAHEFLESIA
ncbi:MAG: PIN domain-containing protein, partial [Opitutales bacterium]